jgi:SAM-dependent methyltransferase
MLADIRFRLAERLGDPWFNVATQGVVPVARVAPGQDDLCDSMPIGYATVLAALRALPVRRAECGFLDYGCGKGRACVAAAALGFRSVTGLELSPELADTARRNLARMRWRRTRRVEIVAGDARSYEIPADVSVIYFFHPFVGQVLRTVMGQMRASLARAPRPLHVVYFNNGDFDWELADATWLKKVDQRRVYPALTRGIYVST